MSEIKKYVLYISKKVGKTIIPLFGRYVEAHNEQQAIRAVNTIYNKDKYPRDEWILELEINKDKKIGL